MSLRFLLMVTLPPLFLAAWAGWFFFGQEEPDPAEIYRMEYQAKLEKSAAAAEIGDYRAYTAYAEMLVAAPEKLRDPKAAFAWFRKAADKGYAPAQVGLGRLYETGDGVPQNYHRASEWYRLAIQLSGAAEAHFRMGEFHFRGRGVAQDYGEALAHYRKAAAKGHPVAQYLLAVMYESGWGVPADVITAYKWFSLAARESGKVQAYNKDFVPKRDMNRLWEGMNQSQRDLAARAAKAALQQ